MRPQVADSGTAPRYRSQVITLADQLVIAVEDEAGQAGGAAVLFKYLLYPVKELSGDLRRLNNLYPNAAQVVREDQLLQVGTSNEKKTNQNKKPAAARLANASVVSYPPSPK